MRLVSRPICCAPVALLLGKSTKLVEVDGIRAFRLQVSIDEDFMGELVFGVVVNVLRHVRIKNGQRSRIGWVSTAARNFAVLDSPKFVVLLPEVGLKDFGRSQESQDCGVAFVETAATFF